MRGLPAIKLDKHHQARNFILRADEGKTLLHAAAEGGSKGMFEAVMAALQHAFGPEKVFDRATFRHIFPVS